MDQSSDDKKRRETSSLEESSGSGRPNKRAALSESNSNANVVSNSSGGNTPLAVSTNMNASSSGLIGGDIKDQNVLVFQNRAMKIRVEEQKHEINDKEYKIRSLNGKVQSFEEIISCLCRVWDQLNSGLNVLSGRLDLEPSLDSLLPNGIGLSCSSGEVPGDSDENNNNSNNNNNNNNDSNNDNNSESNNSNNNCNHFVESYNFLTSYITEPQTLDENYIIEQILQNRIKKTQVAFSKIADSVEREHFTSTSLFRLLKSSRDLNSNDFEKLLKEENDKLSQQNQILQASYDKLLQQCKHLTDQSSYLADQSGIYQISIKELKAELERSLDELNLERKRLIKMQDDIPKIPSIRLSSPSLSSSTTTTTTNGPPTPKLAGSENGSSATSSEEYQELLRQSESRLNEARKLREEKANLMKELQQIQIDIRNIPEDRIVNSMPYQILRQRLQVVSDELDIKTNLFAKLQHELQQLTIARRVDRENYEAFELQRRQGLERRVQQLEGEATELKSEKEKLINIIDQKLPGIPSQEYLAESRLLLETKDSDIQKLKKELEQLKQTSETYRDGKEAITQIESKAQKDIESKNLEIKEITEKLIEATKQNEELKQSEKNLIEKEKELQLSLELFKSSEKGDVVELQVSEKKLKEEVDQLKKSLQSVDQLKQQHQEQVDQLQEKHKVAIRELEVNLAMNKQLQESQKQELDALMMEIDSMGKAYEQMQEQNTRLLKQISDKEDTHAHLMAENIKSQQTIRLTKEATVAMEEKVVRSDEKLKSQAEIMAKIEDKCQVLQKQLSKVTEELHTCNFELEKHKRFVRETSAHSTELKTQWDHLGAMNAELKKKADDSIFALEREIDKAKRLDEEKQILKKKLEKASQNSTPSSASTAEEELRLVNQKLRCSICNDRQKNHVIAKCFHVFCKECIYSNIDTRKRRCPSCKRPFSESDVHQIYLT